MSLTGLDFLSDMIMNAREEKKISQRQLALLTGVSNSEISMIENGKRQKPSINILKKIAEVLELDFEEMLEVLGYINTEGFDNNIQSLTSEEKKFIVDAIQEKWNKNQNTVNNPSLSNKEDIYNILFNQSILQSQHQNLKELYPKGYKKFLKIANQNDAVKDKFTDLMNWFLEYEIDD